MSEIQAENRHHSTPEATDPGDEVRLLEQRIADLKARWPQHSTPPRMWEELEELESLLETALRRAAGKLSPDCTPPSGEQGS